MIVLLDSGPLGLVTNPKSKDPNALLCFNWLRGLVKARVVVCLPEIVDYEIRRELKRAKKSDGLSRLDQLKTVVEYLPLSTEVMNTAAELWAYARNEGIPTAHDAALDIDMILIAQCRVRTKFEDDPVIATVDLGDIPRFIQAKKWQDISIP